MSNLRRLNRRAKIFAGVAAVLFAVAVAGVRGAQAADAPQDGPTGDMLFLPAILARPSSVPNGEIDLTGLALPAQEIRPAGAIPYLKQPERFGKITPQSADIRHSAATPLTVRLLAGKVPRVNEAVNIVLEVHAYEPAPGTVAEIQLPDGAQLLSGNTQARYDLAAGETQRLRAAIVFPQAGEYAITGRALSQISPDLTYGDQDALYLTVGLEVAAVGLASQEDVIALPGDLLTTTLPLVEGAEAETDEDATTLAADLLADRAAVAGVQLAPPVAPTADDAGQVVAAANVTISICWAIAQDRAGGTSPLRDAYMELWDADSSGAPDLLASTNVTQHTGCATFSVNNADTDEGGLIDVYAQIFLTRNNRYRVTNYQNQIYGFSTLSVQGGKIDNVAANLNMGTWGVGGSTGVGRAVWLFDDLYLARRTVEEFRGGLGGTPGFVHVIWQVGGTDGTYYSLSDQRIHLTDLDANSRDVVVHETSHRYMDLMYDIWPPNDCPAPHYINRASGKFCAWTEGFTYFIVSLVDGNPVYKFSSGATVNLETTVCNSVGWDAGPTVEGRVGGLMIDLIDPIASVPAGPVSGFGNEPQASGCTGEDQVSGLFDAIWDLLWDQDDIVLVTQDGFTDSFSNAWESRSYPRYAADRAGDHNTITTFTQD